MAYHNYTTDYSNLVTEIVRDRRGASLLTLSRVAQDHGFHVKGLLLMSYPEIPNCPLPAIVHLRKRFTTGGHFVAIHQWTPTKVVVADPATGIRDISRKAFMRSWTGYLLAVSPTLVPSHGINPSAGSRR